MNKLHVLAAWVTLSIASASTARAEDLGSQDIRHTLSTSVTATYLDQASGRLGAQLGYRLDLPSDWAFGIEVDGALGDEERVSGYVVEDAAIGGARLVGYAPLASRGPLTMSWRFAIGAELASGDPTGPLADELESTSTRVTVDFGPLATVDAGEHVQIRTGVLFPFAMELSPTTDLAQMGNYLRFGAGLAVSDEVSLTADADVGGLFGYNGDGFKSALRGTVGVVWSPGAGVRREASESDFPVFFGVEWRALALAEHFSHGPGAHVGVHFLDGWMRAGIMAYARSGPLNPKTFKLNRAYKGQSSVDLRSDGAFIGAFIAPVLPVPGTDRLYIELPLALGQAGYGFYLTGDDRLTPDGRKTSDWENELMDGKDSSIVLGADVGIRLDVRVTDWMEVNGGVHYAKAFGYDAFIRDSYDGFSTVLGARFGAF